MLEAPGSFVWSHHVGLLAVTTHIGHRSGLQTARISESAVQRSLERVHLRWAINLVSEVGFWHDLLNTSAVSDKAGKKSARHWLATGEVRWAWDDICVFLEDAHNHVGQGYQYGTPRVLNVGSGPLTPGPLRCSIAGGHSDTTVVSADGLARLYLHMFDELQVEPPHVPLQCSAETLRQCFPRDHFDVVHMRNALDHAMDPLSGLTQMLQVTRPGGWVLLRHARNEGLPGLFRLGLHQWAFDVADAETKPRFIIWSPELRADVSAWLLSSALVESVRTELRPHPDGVGEEYVWVDIKRSASDARAR